ncbi:hypothetical protein HN680_00475, partial [Candidatus Peregrinibacteria bacterium]|nr:hypothetical protein [Candidatus Peregrinibacteria bacterium]
PEIDALISEPLNFEIRLPTTDSSPLEMAMVAAALSNKGIAPAPRLALAIDTPQSGWVILPALGEEATLFAPEEAAQLVTAFSGEEAYWQILSIQESEKNLTWLLAGTPSDWRGTPLALTVLLEENNPALAEEIARNLLGNAP